MAHQHQTGHTVPSHTAMFWVHLDLSKPVSQKDSPSPSTTLPPAQLGPAGHPAAGLSVPDPSTCVTITPVCFRKSIPLSISFA